MKFVNRVPASGKENRKLIRVCDGENVANKEFYVDVLNADDATPANQGTALSAENLNNLTVNAKNIEGEIDPSNLPKASEDKLGVIRMYVIGSTLYLENR